MGDTRWRRLADIRAHAKSPFQFDVQGSVAKSIHASILALINGLRGPPLAMTSAPPEPEHGEINMKSTHKPSGRVLKGGLALLFGIAIAIGNQAVAQGTTFSLAQSGQGLSKACEIAQTMAQMLSTYYPTPHSWAAEGDIERIQEYLDGGGDVNEGVGSSDGPLLTAAAFAGQVSMVNFLLTQGADVDGAQSSGDTPLHSAVVGCFLEVAEALIEAGADVDATGSMGRPLQIAKRFKLQEMVRLLHDHGAR